MSRECEVPTCKAEGRHAMDSEATRMLCYPHTKAWDDSEDERVGRLMDLQFAKPEATDEEVWAEMVSEWLGTQAGGQRD